MKKFKLLSSIAAVAAISCVTAVSSMAADAVDFKINAAKSTADTKVIEVYYKGDSFDKVQGFQIQLKGLNFSDVECATDFDSFSKSNKNGDLVIKNTSTASGRIAVVDKSCLLATITVSNTDTFNMSMVGGSVSGHLASDPTTGSTTLQHNKGTLDYSDVAAVVKPAELGIFAEGEGPAVKAYKADAAVEGEITWFVTDGTNVATKYVADVTGGANVVVGLTVKGDNVANINYAAVAID